MTRQSPGGTPATPTAKLPANRAAWAGLLFPEGIPQLWCPPVTHYTAQGAIDAPRISAHLRFLSAWVGGLLAPGSTGDGWELTETEVQVLLELLVEEAQRHHFHLLIGALNPDAAAAHRQIIARLAWLQERSATRDPVQSLLRNRVCGFAVCPPRGAGLSETEIEAGLSPILELGLPIALYQLPQVTQNEMSPALLARLAGRFPNFILFKDTSGEDRVVQARGDTGGVFLVRGAEGRYAQWLKLARGQYDGWLLSTANGFAPYLYEILVRLKENRPASAIELSDQLSVVVEQVFALVRGLPDGNPFANAAKAVDHFLAHGPLAAEAPPPRLHAGSCLPESVVRATGTVLNHFGMMPESGYLGSRELPG